MEVLSDLNNNEVFATAISKAASIEEAQKVFSEFGVDVSTKDLEKIAMNYNKKSEGELSEDDLEAVSGGAVVTLIVIAGVVYKVAELMGIPRWIAKQLGLYTK